MPLAHADVVSIELAFVNRFVIEDDDISYSADCNFTPRVSLVRGN